MKAFKDIGNIAGKKVLVRVDFNVPIQDGKVIDVFRITQTIPTLNVLKEKGAKIILISHYEGKDGDTLLPVFNYLKDTFDLEFVKDPFSPDGRIKMDTVLSSGKVVLVENVRAWKGEKENTEDFAKMLASLGEIYVLDAFGASHRKHASIVGVPKILPSFAGLLFEQEVKVLSKAFNPIRPFLFILGGAKFDTKMPLIEKFFKKADMVFVGGALANNFFKDKGFNIGQSLVSEGDFNFKQFSADRLFLPIDVVAKSSLKSRNTKPEEVLSDEIIMDSGPETLGLLQKLIWKAEFIVWNGPLGNYELGFTKATEDLARAIAQSKRESIVGGGDTLAAINKLDLFKKISFVSTGGGAMLDFLVNETLPGIEALK